MDKQGDGWVSKEINTERAGVTRDGLLTFFILPEGEFLRPQIAIPQDILHVGGWDGRRSRLGAFEGQRVVEYAEERPEVVEADPAHRAAQPRGRRTPVEKQAGGGGGFNCCC